MGYTDDAALLDYHATVSSERVTSIVKGSVKDADMAINVTKTKVMYVCKQSVVSKTTTTEAKEMCKFSCPNVGCTRVFFNKHGMCCHAGRCKWKDVYLIDRIVDVRGPARSSKQEFLIEWKGYGRAHGSWVYRYNIDPDCVTEYLKANDMYDYNWSGKHCPHCYLPCKSKFGVFVHLRSCKYVHQNCTDTLADRKVRRDKVVDVQTLNPTVTYEVVVLDNVFMFSYLDSKFIADGDHSRDVEYRCVMTMSRCGELRAVLG